MGGVNKMRRKKFVALLLFLMFFIPSVVYADVTVYVKTALTGGAAGALDSIDGAGLVDGDLAFVFTSNVFYTYRLDDDSGAAESSPSVIAPDSNSGDKRWLLQNSYNVGYSSISGTPTEHQQAVWTGDGTIKGVTVTGSKVMCTDANGEPVACTNLTDVAFSGYVPTSWIVRAGTNNVLTYTGDYSLGITLSGATSVTFPTTGTLATTSQLATDNSTANNLVAKDSDGHIENLTLDSHLSRTGTTSPALAVVTPTIIYAAGTDTGPTAAQMSGPGVIVKNYGQAAADIFVPLPAAAAGLSGLFTVVTAQASNHWGVKADTNDGIYIVAAAGTISAKGTDGACAVMVAAQLGQSFACWTQATGETTFDWFCKAVAIGTSTFEAHAAP